MAYTNTPQVSTYRTTRFSLGGNPGARNGTTLAKDQRFVNLFPEKMTDPFTGDKKLFLKERPGLVHKLNVGVTGAGRGVFYFNGHQYSVIGNTLYQDTTAKATLGNSTGKVGWTEFNGTYTALILLDGIKGWVIKTDLSVTEITDADFPTPHLPTPVFLDGYLFVAKSGTDDIYNCDLEDPLTWTAGNFITAELYPDKLMALAKNNNYLYAVGEQTIEYFYDAAIVSGSPLQRNDSAVQQMGTPASDTVVQTDDAVVFVGTTENGGRTVWTIVGFKPTDISIEPIRQSLDAEGTSITSANAFCIRSMGHKFYVLTLSTRTWVYDFDEGLWHEWTYTDSTTPFHCQYTCDHPDGHARTIHPTNGNVLAFSDTVQSDANTSTTTTAIYCVATTHKVDFDSNNRKFCYRLSVLGDAPNSAANTAITVQWSDDDYTTWSTARTLNISNSMSAITQLGYFRRRAFKFTYNAAYPLRLEGFELDINIGQT